LDKIIREWKKELRKFRALHTRNSVVKNSLPGNLPKIWYAAREI